jgi:hypothetical protein
MRRAALWDRAAPAAPFRSSAPPAQSQHPSERLASIGFPWLWLAFRGLRPWLFLASTLAFPNRGWLFLAFPFRRSAACGRFIAAAMTCASEGRRASMAGASDFPEPGLAARPPGAQVRICRHLSASVDIRRTKRGIGGTFRVPAGRRTARGGAKVRKSPPATGARRRHRLLPLSRGCGSQAAQDSRVSVLLIHNFKQRARTAKVQPCLA